MTSSELFPNYYYYYVCNVQRYDLHCFGILESLTDVDDDILENKEADFISCSLSSKLSTSTPKLSNNPFLVERQEPALKWSDIVSWSMKFFNFVDYRLIRPIDLNPAFVAALVQPTARHVQWTVCSVSRKRESHCHRTVSTLGSATEWACHCGF